MIENSLETGISTTPLSDVGMPIQPGAQCPDGIIQVHHTQLIEPTERLKRGQNRFGTICRAHIVTRCCDMTCVQTEAKSFRLFHPVSNPSQVTEIVAQVGARPGGGLQTGHDLITGCFLMKLVQGVNDSIQATFFVGRGGCAEWMWFSTAQRLSQMRAGMRHQKRDREGGTSLDFISLQGE